MNVELSLTLSTKMEDLHRWLVLFVELCVDKIMATDPSASYDKMIAKLNLDVYDDFFQDLENFIREKNITLEILLGENIDGEKYNHDLKGIVFNYDSVNLLQTLITKINNIIESSPEYLEKYSYYHRKPFYYDIESFCNPLYEDTKYRVERLSEDFCGTDRHNAGYLEESEILSLYFQYVFMNEYETLVQEYLERKLRAL